jgi:hypothetical protein
MAYLIKLYIEMNMAELIGKVLKRPNRRRNSFSTPDIWRADSHTSEVFNREWRGRRKTFLPSGGQMHELNLDMLREPSWGGIYGAVGPGADEDEQDEQDERNEPREPAMPEEAHRKGSVTSSTEQLNHCTCHNRLARDRKA